MRKILTISAFALAAALGGAVVAHAEEAKSPAGERPLVQKAFWGHGDDGRHGGRFDRAGRHGPRGEFGRHGGHRGGKMIEAFDANKDGAVTQAEIDEFRQGQIARFDANKDGTLSLDEYQALWLEQMRERMVDAFQRHDNDGNGQVTAEEFNKRFVGLVDRLDRNGDGQLNADDRGGRSKHDRQAPPPPGAPPAAPAPAP